MAGRHGKLSGSPFHVQTIKSVAAEKYGDHYKKPIPPCKYRRNHICLLNECKEYNKQCAYHKCKYLNRVDNEHISRDSCVYANKNACFYFGRETECKPNNDLSFCCQYFLDTDKNPGKHQALTLMHEINEINKRIDTLQSSIKKAVKRRKWMCVEIRKRISTPNCDMNEVHRLSREVHNCDDWIECNKAETIEYMKQLSELKKQYNQICISIKQSVTEKAK